MIKQKFSTFLDDALSQKEVSFIIAEHENELSHFQRWLDDRGYQSAANATELLRMAKQNKKLYSILDSEDAKNDYDFAVQYPTGQVELFEPKSMKGITETLEYKNRSVIFLVTRHHLSQLEKKNYNFLSVVGIAFRPEAHHA